jgi:hypothetical protein
MGKGLWLLLARAMLACGAPLLPHACHFASQTFSRNK